ncbi:RNase adapter RapZ [Pseudooctadecabacter jejudonensis]|uniref:GlmZ(SRNA)-inactivating NTPase n=1 Tax=Pseudooctadecabacter jejudonensis TaxID=1391910 RepID=A0A1Y5RZW1_9RHOB|nr:RNase adapter RapZ [Pseudooctadecabacter jejudonensis]SLN29125.1 glmZ(sRNA)-inactivating NTPase [Pseudooctadecabacter jejudonensis]
MSDHDTRVQKIIMVSGPSGAGRSTAINVLEDLGYEAIDNMPLSLMPRLTDGPLTRPLAIGIDVRNRDFSLDRVKEALDLMATRIDIDAQLLFLEASEDALVRRYSETRRRHPLAPDEPAIQGIRREADILSPLRAEAEFLLDTSDLSPHDLKARLTDWFGEKGAALFGITLQSFSYKRGLPKASDMTFDCRFLKNPYWDAALRGLTGLDGDVGKHIEGDRRLQPFLHKTTDLLNLLLPAFREEGKSHISIGFGCTGGQHRSVYVTECIALALAEKGWQVSKRHRELDRAGVSAQGSHGHRTQT